MSSATNLRPLVESLRWNYGLNYHETADLLIKSGLVKDVEQFEALMRQMDDEGAG